MFSKHRSLPFVAAAIGLGATLTGAYCAIQLYHPSKTRKAKAIITASKENAKETDDSWVPRSKQDEVIMTIDPDNNIELVLEPEPDAEKLAEQEACLNKFAKASISPFSIRSVLATVSPYADWNADNLDKFRRRFEMIREKTIPSSLRPSPVGPPTTLDVRLPESPIIPIEDRQDAGLCFSSVQTLIWKSHRNQLPLMLNRNLGSGKLRLISLTLECKVTTDDCTFLLYEFRHSLQHFYVDHILRKEESPDDLPGLTLDEDRSIWSGTDKPSMRVLKSMHVKIPGYTALKDFWLLRPGEVPATATRYPAEIRELLTEIPWRKIQEGHTNVAFYPRMEKRARREIPSY
ncbi:hypothetical protein H0H92_004942 [Tricholoma furcatifolium]|nr:hypothetical protein H0H92_004942 [Tricholoma furcatifolium]